MVWQKNICFAFIPPRTLEMNPIEQIWAKIRKEGKFKNVLISALNKEEEQLIEAVKNLSNETVKSENRIISILLVRNSFYVVFQDIKRKRN